MTKAPDLKTCPFEVLMQYQQADEEGIMVLVSRQAIHEAVDEWNRRAALDLAPVTPVQAVDALLPLVTDEVADELRAIAEGGA